MRKKTVKKLKKMAALITQNNPSQTKKVYKNLKQVHKDIKGEI